MIKLFVMNGKYINTEKELKLDGSENSITGVYQVNVSEWEYENEQGNTIDRILLAHNINDEPLPDGYEMILKEV